MSKTSLQWCHGCQSNVRPKWSGGLGPKCPRCGNPISMFDPPDTITGVDDDLDLDLDPDEGFDLFERDTIQTPGSGRLTLNPKVDGVPRVPLCPECEAPIKRVEHDHAPLQDEEFVTVEFVCGCDDLRYFEFPERSDNGELSEGGTDEPE